MGNLSATPLIKSIFGSTSTDNKHDGIYRICINKDIHIKSQDTHPADTMIMIRDYTESTSTKQQRKKAENSLTFTELFIEGGHLLEVPNCH